MERITESAAMRAWADGQRAAGRRIALVPTMGYLHLGHLRLIEEARGRADVTVVSIFVNPMQFGPSEDLASYPRDLERDCRGAREAGAAVVFTPDARQMYPEGFETHVEVERATHNLCGVFRPGHFRGVTTVVAKLFHLIQPHVAVFGQKDFQQLAVIRRMVRDLDFGIEVVGVPTVREADGLALSSRNTYLGADERRAALCVPRSLAAARALVECGTRDAARIVATARQVIEAEPLAKAEYITLADPETIQPVETVRGPTLLALAVRIGCTRLIDNCVLGSNTDAADASPPARAAQENQTPRGV